MAGATIAMNDLLKLLENSWPLAVTLTVLALIGLLKLLSTVFSLLSFVYVHFLRPGISVKKFGPWAVVTGATDGIGKAFCIELAKKGINILLVSRTESKLRECSQELETKYKVKTKFVAVDLVKPTEDNWKELEESFNSVEVGLLINNAGLSYDHFEYTDALDETEIANLLSINVASLTKLCRLVLPAMKQRRRGYIVNMGSGSGLIPFSPFLSVYAGTKAYVDALSRAMDSEYRRFGVHVQCQAPFFVATKLAKIRKPRLDVPSAQTYAQGALKHIGYEASTLTHWVHKIMYNVLSALPKPIAEKYVFDMHFMMRKKYYKKLEAQGKKQ